MEGNKEAIDREEKEISLGYGVAPDGKTGYTNEVARLDEGYIIVDEKATKYERRGRTKIRKPCELKGKGKDA